MEELKEKLVALCNASNLPIEAVYFVTKDLWRDAEEALKQYKEREMREQKIQKEMTKDFGQTKEVNPSILEEIMNNEDDEDEEE